MKIACEGNGSNIKIWPKGTGLLIHNNLHTCHLPNNGEICIVEYSHYQFLVHVLTTMGHGSHCSPKIICLITCNEF